MQFIDLHKQYERIETNIQQRMASVYEHKRFISGPEVIELEEALKEYTDIKHVIACASGTDALTIPLMSKKLKKEDAVFVPSFTFFASAESVTLAGGTPVFVDSDKDTFNIDPKNLEQQIEVIQKKGKLKPCGVIPVDLFGLPANHQEIRKIAEKYGLFVLEDAAQGFGGQIEGEKATSFGDIASTSFFPAKPLGCYGDGGAIFTNDDAAAELMRSIHVHGQGLDKYDNVRIGLNSRLDTIQAVVLLEKLKIFDEEVELRNEIAAEYSRQLKEELEVPKVPQGYRSCWAQYTVKAQNKQQRDQIIEDLKAKNIPAMIYYRIPIHKSTAYYEDNVHTVLPVCEHLSDTVFSLPMHPYLEKQEITAICDSIKASLK